MSCYSAAASAQWFLEGSRKYGTRGFKKAAASFAPDDLNVDMRGRIACVTGANSGIGYCVAKSLAARNCTVHMLCRNKQRGEEARSRVLVETGNSDVHLHVVDVSDFRQVETFASSFLESNQRLHVLVNNAGGIPSERVETPQGHEGIMATMLGGTFLLTKLLLPALEGASTNNSGDGEGGPNNLGGSARARVINVSSGGMYTVAGGGVSEDMDSRRVEPYDGTLIYALAKRAQVTLTEGWAALNRRVSFNSMHPGWCDTPGLSTGMPNFHKRQQGSLRSTKEGADTIIWLACSESADGGTGKFWFDRKTTRTHMPWAGTRMTEPQEKALWEAADLVCSER